jgi:hypothetical protein
MASWYYNSRTGSVVQGGTPAAALALLPEALSFGAGWHGTFPSRQAALNYYSQNAGANPGWKAPAGIASNLKNDVTTTPAATASAAKQAAQKAAAAAAGALKYTLNIGNTGGLLTRILKVGFGAILIIAGVLQFSGSSRTLADVVPLVGKPAGKVLRA